MEVCSAYGSKLRFIICSLLLFSNIGNISKRVTLAGQGQGSASGASEKLERHNGRERQQKAIQLS